MEENKEEIQENILTFGITLEQAEKLCKYFNKDINKLNDTELCALLNKLLDNLDVENHIPRID